MLNRLMACLLLPFVVPMDSALAQETTVGEVESVQLLDASQLGGGDHLILVLEDGQGFRLPGQRSLAVGAGVRVSVAYRPSDDAESLPEACRVQVLAVPIERDGEEAMQQAERPFDVYRNEAASAKC